jgi:hypothetical protein
MGKNAVEKTPKIQKSTNTDKSDTNTERKNHP